MAATRGQQPTSRRGRAASLDDGAVSVEHADWRDARYQAFALLRIAFTVAPIAFGLDKFFNVMVDWPIYLAPWINDIAPGSGQDFMYFVGAIEIVAGVLVAHQAPLRRLRRRGLAGRHHPQPAHALRLLRRRAARLRAHARRPHPGPSRLGLRPPAATRPPLSTADRDQVPPCPHLIAAHANRRPGSGLIRCHESSAPAAVRAKARSPRSRPTSARDPRSPASTRRSSSSCARWATTGVGYSARGKRGCVRCRSIQVCTAFRSH